MSTLGNQPPQVPPIACTLGSSALGTQIERWMKLYAGAGTERVETDDGLRVSFRSDPAVETELRDLVAIELECCAWADWSIQRAAEQLTLAISAKGDGVPVIHTWLLDQTPVLPTSSLS
jgi:hypothetical protein